MIPLFCACWLATLVMWMLLVLVVFAGRVMVGSCGWSEFVLEGVVAVMIRVMVV